MNSNLLVKIESNSNSSSHGRNVQYSLEWNDIPIDIKYRSFIKNIENDKIAANWTLKDRNKEYHYDHNRYDWDTFWSSMTTINRLYIASLKENHDYAFIIKSVHEILPILSILNKRSPDIYKHNTCILCNSRCEETIAHLSECSYLQLKWEQTELQISREFRKFLEKELKDEEEFIEVALFDNILFPKFSGNKRITNIHNQRLNRWKGFLDITCKNTIMQAFSLSKSKTLKILTNFLCINWKAIHDHIWKTRCEHIIEWERIKGISSKEKRYLNINNIILLIKIK